MLIKINRAIIHILDSNSDAPLRSDNCTELCGGLQEFFVSHMEKILNDSGIKNCEFCEGSKVPELLQGFPDKFIEISKYFADEFFKIMHSNGSIPSADLAVVDLQVEGEACLAILKMNYRESYIHYLQNTESGILNTIITQRTTLPSPKNKVDEAVCINLVTGGIKLIEKSYEIDGNKSNYISASILECTKAITEKQKFDVIKKALTQVTQKYAREESDKTELPAKLFEELCGDNTFKVEHLCQKMCPQTPDARQELQEILEKKEISPKEEVTVSQSTVQRLAKQSIKSSDGVEIKIPVANYENLNSVEFINNPDGTISLLIKNILL
ncbi:MAG: nucleoid-associated protein [Oscillospiraceae bacterium]